MYYREPSRTQTAATNNLCLDSLRRVSRQLGKTALLLLQPSPSAERKPLSPLRTSPFRRRRRRRLRHRRVRCRLKLSPLYIKNFLIYCQWIQSLKILNEPIKNEISCYACLFVCNVWVEETIFVNATTAGPFLILYAFTRTRLNNLIYPWPCCCWAGSSSKSIDPLRRKVMSWLEVHSRGGIRNIIPNTKYWSQTKAGHLAATLREHIFHIFNNTNVFYMKNCALQFVV